MFSLSRKRVLGLPLLINQRVGFKTQTKTIKVYEPLPNAHKDGKPLMDVIRADQYKKLDPSGIKQKLLDSKNPTRLRSGDIVRINYKNNIKPSITGMIIALNRAGLESNLLLRNQVTKIGVELRVSVFNPIIERIDILRKPMTYRPRNKLYYIRNNRLDVGDLENVKGKKLL
ncbi:hypothetical protein PACTADRAFT_35394 [Pachysolen tannophilus NRRL Y-2460]|uniref:Ribosomal protein L19 n=1 Tax=Pachysolen tannophilus NRRL Y-2460 TaxID=669874 RepID=A0A1E4TPE4_PACTA|nr:hypothetical protein PACTADRAFT_35394 [Pachysolen tannophilus NRRL Y-2460]